MASRSYFQDQASARRARLKACDRRPGRPVVQPSIHSPMANTMGVVDLPSAKTRRLIVISMLAVGLAAVAAAVLVYRDSPGASALPAAIQAVEPEPFSNVLLQNDVSVDLGPGYTGTLEINGIPIPEEQLDVFVGLNKISYEPRDGKIIDDLRADRNCVTVNYWLQEQGEASKQNFTWCFDAG